MVTADTPVITLQNRSFKFGEGLFETIRVDHGTIPLANFHRDRLFKSMETLHMPIPERNVWQQWMDELLQLCALNDCSQHARVRLTITTNENEIMYGMEATTLDPSYLVWNKKGEVIDICPLVQKQVDHFSNIKATNYLLYLMAGHYARENKLDDCLVLNSHNNISDSTRANVFLVKDGEMYTPALDQGCIQGVMRQKLIIELEKKGNKVHQQAINKEDLQKAQEVFLTNALYGLRWVRSFGTTNYEHAFSSQLYHEIIATIFS